MATERIIEPSCPGGGGPTPPPNPTPQPRSCSYSLFPLSGPPAQRGPPTPTLWAGRQTGLEQNGTGGRNVPWAERDWRPLPPISQEGGDEGNCWLPPPSCPLLCLPPTCTEGFFPIWRVRRVHSPPSIMPVGWATGLLLVGEVDGLWVLGRGSFPS